MTEDSLLLHAFGDRLAEAFLSIARYISEEVPIILEPLIDEGQSDIRTEMQRAREALGDLSFATV
jgi:hypothetical protein